MNVLIDSSYFPTPISTKSGHGRIWSNLFRRLPSDMDVFCNSRIRNLPTPMPKPLRGGLLPILRPYRIAYLISEWISSTSTMHYAAPKFMSLFPCEAGRSSLEIQPWV